METINELMKNIKLIIKKAVYWKIKTFKHLTK